MCSQIGGGFRTDTEISGGYDGGERELQRWTPDNDDPGLDRYAISSRWGLRALFASVSCFTMRLLLHIEHLCGTACESLCSSLTRSSPDTCRLCRETFGASGSRGWDQFSVNEKLYGYHSTYREELYTTELDKNSAAYRSRINDAARIADEIEKVCPRHGMTRVVIRCQLYRWCLRKVQ